MNAAAKFADSLLGKVDTSTPAQPLPESSKMMKAVVWYGKKDVRVVEKPRPTIVDTKDVLIKITATTICGSDLHLYRNTIPDMHEGDILGHEFMGIITEIGSEVRRLNVGQRVVVSFDIACGKCDYCKREEYTACDTTNPTRLMDYMYGHRTAALFGYSHLTGGVPGGQAEYVRVPFAEMNCLPIPDDVPDEKALYLSDIVPTSLHGVELGKVKEGTTVGIWGLGPVGLLAARWCQIRKAGRIVGIDCVPERLDRAKLLGIETIDFKKEKTLERVSQMVPGGFDVSIECAGFDYSTSILHRVEQALNLETDTSEILSEMIYATRKFGIVSIIGVYAGFTNHFPIGALMEKGLHMTGSQSPTQKYWKYCLEEIQKGEFDPTIVVTHTGRLDDAAELYRKFNEKEEGTMKVFLRP